MQPVLDWIKRVDPISPQLTLEELRQEQDAFLNSQRASETVEDAERWIHRRWKVFFVSFLHELYTEESWCPKNRSIKMFKEWFEVQCHSMVWNLADETVQHEDWE